MWKLKGIINVAQAQYVGIWMGRGHNTPETPCPFVPSVGFWDVPPCRCSLVPLLDSHGKCSLTQRKSPGLHHAAHPELQTKVHTKLTLVLSSVSHIFKHTLRSWLVQKIIIEIKIIKCKKVEYNTIIKQTNPSTDTNPHLQHVIMRT